MCQWWPLSRDEVPPHTCTGSSSSIITHTHTKVIAPRTPWRKTQLASISNLVLPLKALDICSLPMSVPSGEHFFRPLPSPSYILQVPNHAFSDHPNKGRGDRDLGQRMASTNYSCISTSNSWQCVQCQLTGWHQSTGPSLHKGREAPWTEQDQWLVSVGPRWCWLSDCTYNCVCVYLVVEENG